ncbi:MAG: methylated-DNA--[protein]-cysteine S-methyltransferase [Sandaracinaceae bacterium]
MSSDAKRIADAIEITSRRWDDPPSLEALAAEVGLSPAHFQRLFRRMTGVSPKRFAQALAADRAERMLTDARPLLDATFASGLSSPGRLHDLMVNVRAMTPGELRRGGAGLAIRWGLHETPFGPCMIATTDRGICELVFVDDARPWDDLDRFFPNATRIEDPDATRPVLDALLDAGARSGPITLHLRGTNFQLRVWQALLAIPPDRFTSYGALASAMGCPNASRAVGRAVGSNPVSWIIPCHRVLRKQGELGGYRWGLDKKRALLAWEHARSSP